MTDRVRELLKFDLTLLESMAAGRTVDEAVESVELPELRGTSEPIRIVGFDEAGRGALAGPVAVGCVHVDLDRRAALPLDREELIESLAGLDDSKRLTPRRREAVFEAILSGCDWAIGYASAREIDRRGIVRACRLAARRAIAGLRYRPDVGVFDRGLSLAEEGTTRTLPELQFTRGDARSLHIAAASIVAKVGRDAIMEQLGRRFPEYGLAGHKGYGTIAHRDAIHRFGPSAVHRRSFCSRIEGAQSQSC